MNAVEKISLIFSSLGEAVASLGDPTHAPSADAVSFLERQQLGHLLPGEYRDFLLGFGSAEIREEQFYSIFVPFGEVRGATDIHFRYKTSIELGELTSRQVPFFSSSYIGVGLYYFECEAAASGRLSGESVYRFLNDENDKIADSFSEFLIWYIKRNGLIS